MIGPRIGELKERIDIIEVSLPYDIKGEGVQTSALAEDIWAKVEPLAGGMTDTTQQGITTTQPYNIWIRYMDGVTAVHQINWGGRRLVQTGPPENFNDRWLLIHAEEKVIFTP